ncbi:MAG: class I SAM-dependent methyltransferase [Rhodospirillales bacterium]|nr:class I SAM-dependent methyltransferase [Rhodospirillales bacterium]
MIDTENICGPGHLAASLAEAGANVVGLDFAMPMVAKARENYLNPDFRQGDAEALSFGGHPSRQTLADNTVGFYCHTEAPRLVPLDRGGRIVCSSTDPISRQLFGPAKHCSIDAIGDVSGKFRRHRIACVFDGSRHGRGHFFE